MLLMHMCGYYHVTHAAHAHVHNNGFHFHLVITAGMSISYFCSYVSWLEAVDVYCLVHIHPAIPKRAIRNTDGKILLLLATVHKLLPRNLVQSLFMLTPFGAGIHPEMGHICYVSWYPNNFIASHKTPIACSIMECCIY